MKKMFTLIFVVLLSISIFGESFLGVYPKRIDNPCNSASLEDETILFNVDIVDTLNEAGEILSVNSVDLFISIDDQVSWGEISPTHDGSIDYENTYYYSWSPAQDVVYYFRAETDSTVSSESPKYAGALDFPTENYYVTLDEDPAGDHLSVNVEGSNYSWDNCDLRNFEASYSDDRLYFKISTEDGLELTRSVFLRDCFLWEQDIDFYHLYKIDITNPNDLDSEVKFSIVFAEFDLSVGSVSFSMTPGAYKFNESEDLWDYFASYEKISNTSNFVWDTSGNTISFSFEKSILEDDPDFSELEGEPYLVRALFQTLAGWPDECASIYPENFLLVTTDISRKIAFYPRTHTYDVGENTEFELSDLSHSLVAGGYEVSVVYTDPDNNCPTERQLEIGGCYPTVYAMTSSDHRYDDGSEFVVEFTSPDVAKIPYRVIFSDGIHTEATPWDTINTGIAIIDIAFSDDETSAEVYLDPMDCNESYISLSDDSLRIVNRGTVAIDLGLRVVSIEGVSMTFGIKNNPALDSFAVRVILNNAEFPPLELDYNSALDYLVGETIWSDGARFGGGGYQIISECYNGELYSLVDISDRVWFKLLTPIYARDMPGDVNLTITIEMISRAHLF